MGATIVPKTNLAWYQTIVWGIVEYDEMVLSAYTDSVDAMYPSEPGLCGVKTVTSQYRMFLVYNLPDATADLDIEYDQYWGNVGDIGTTSFDLLVAFLSYTSNASLTQNMAAVIECPPQQTEIVANMSLIS